MKLKIGSDFYLKDIYDLTLTKHLNYRW